MRGRRDADNRRESGNRTVMTIVRGPDYFGDVLGSLRLPCSGRTTPS
jgi:hypothetical protein